MTRFELVDRYMLSRLGAVEENIQKGKINAVESGRRTTKELIYGYLHFLWWVEFIDGTHIISVPHGCRSSMEMFLGKHGIPDIASEQFCSELRQFMDNVAQKQIGKGISLCLQDLMHACDKDTIVSAPDLVETVRIIDKNVPVAQGLHLPPHHLPDSIVHGVLADGHIASVAYAHRTGEYQDIAADIGVETAPGYRRRGYAKAAVNAVARHVMARGGEALYKCAPDNTASRATASSAGFQPYGKGLILAVR